jgi:hypothetical protein
LLRHLKIAIIISLQKTGLEIRLKVVFALIDGQSYGLTPLMGCPCWGHQFRPGCAPVERRLYEYQSTNFDWQQRHKLRGQRRAHKFPCAFLSNKSDAVDSGV